MRQLVALVIATASIAAGGSACTEKDPSQPSTTGPPTQSASANGPSGANNTGGSTPGATQGAASGDIPTVIVDGQPLNFPSNTISLEGKCQPPSSELALSYNWLGYHGPLGDAKFGSSIEISLETDYAAPPVSNYQISRIIITPDNGALDSAADRHGFQDGQYWASTSPTQKDSTDGLRNVQIAKTSDGGFTLNANVRWIDKNTHEPADPWHKLVITVPASASQKCNIS